MDDLAGGAGVCLSTPAKFAVGTLTESVLGRDAERFGSYGARIRWASLDGTL